MAKKKSLAQFSTSDFLTDCVANVWDTVRLCAAEVNSVYPMLTYMIGGERFAVPMSRAMFTDLGDSMLESPASIPIIMGKMGMEFALLALQMSKAKAVGVDVDTGFVREIECMTRSIGPDCIVFSAPVLRRRRWWGTGSGPNAVVVIGKNRVRTFSVVKKMTRGPGGEIDFGEAEFADSLLGDDSDFGCFSNVYEPSRN